MSLNIIHKAHVWRAQIRTVSPVTNKDNAQHAP